MGTMLYSVPEKNHQKEVRYLELVESLIAFGLTRQEASIYIELVRDGSLTGYEVSKNTGISRSNTYTALAGLVDKGAAYLIEGTATKYVPVPVSEFCNNKIAYLTKISTDIVNMMPQEQKKEQGYITIKGKTNIDNKVRNLLNEVNFRVYISLDYEFLKSYKQELITLCNKGKKVVIITDKPLEIDGAIEYISKKKHNSQIRLITDSVNVLTGDIFDDYSTCLYSDKKNLVDIFKEALSNEIELIKLTIGEL